MAKGGPGPGVSIVVGRVWRNVHEETSLFLSDSFGFSVFGFRFFGFSVFRIFSFPGFLPSS
jgi:hypothetical protein